MNVSATIIAFYLPVFIMIVLYFQVSVTKQTESSQKCTVLQVVDPASSLIQDLPLQLVGIVQFDPMTGPFGLESEFWSDTKISWVENQLVT